MDGRYKGIGSSQNATVERPNRRKIATPSAVSQKFLVPGHRLSSSIRWVRLLLWEVCCWARVALNRYKYEAPEGSLGTTNAPRGKRMVD